ncbi:MAG: hypothetical protein WKG07_39750 [Hymenobacter sp.]
MTNELFRQLFGNRPVVGRCRLREALPELADQPFSRCSTRRTAPAPPATATRPWPSRMPPTPPPAGRFPLHLSPRSRATRRAR